MKLYLISQNQNQKWDTYDLAVVCAPDEDTARIIHPNGTLMLKEWESHSWCESPEYVSVKYIGEAADNLEIGVVCSSCDTGC